MNRDKLRDFDDDEAVLLAEQEQFLRAGTAPAARVTRVVPSKSTGKKPSLFAQKQKAKREEAQNQEKSVELESTPLDKIFIQDRIIENKTDNFVFLPPDVSQQPAAFPKVLHRSKNPVSLTKKPIEPEKNKETPNVTISITKNFQVQYSKIEEEKLKWTEPLEQKQVDKNAPKDDRFDFQGRLITEEKEGRYTPELYQHGDDPTSPGYTISELIQFTRSAFPSQRVIGFNTLAAIVKNARTRQFVPRFGI